MVVWAKPRHSHSARCVLRGAAYFDQAHAAAGAALSRLFGAPGAGHSAPEVVALINPWSGKLIQLVDPRHLPLAPTVPALQRALHFGQDLGWVRRILLCLSGLPPTIFAFTGIAMWLGTRGARRRTVQPHARSISSAKRAGGIRAMCSADLTSRVAIPQRADRANLLQPSQDM